MDESLSGSGLKPRMAAMKLKTKPSLRGALDSPEKPSLEHRFPGADLRSEEECEHDKTHRFDRASNGKFVIIENCSYSTGLTVLMLNYCSLRAVPTELQLLPLLMVGSCQSECRSDSQ